MCTYYIYKLIPNNYITQHKRRQRMIPITITTTHKKTGVKKTKVFNVDTYDKKQCDRSVHEVIVYIRTLEDHNLADTHYIDVR